MAVTAGNQYYRSPKSSFDSKVAITTFREKILYALERLIAKVRETN